MEQLKEDALGEFLEVFPFGDDVEVSHGEVDAHAFEFHSLMHVTQVEQLDDVFEVDDGDQLLLAQPLQPVKSVLVRRYQDFNNMVIRQRLRDLVCVDEF